MSKFSKFVVGGSIILVASAGIMAKPVPDTQKALRCYEFVKRLNDKVEECNKRECTQKEIIEIKKQIKVFAEECKEFTD